MVQVLDTTMMTEAQLTKVVPAPVVDMVKNVSRIDQACRVLHARFEVRALPPPRAAL